MPQPEEWLADSLVALADTLTPGLEPTVYFGTLIGAFHRLTEPSSVWLLTVDDREAPSVAAATDDVGEALAYLELAAEHGPAFDTMTGDQDTVDAALPGAHWPRFGPAANAAGMHRAYGFVLRRYQHTVGAVGVACVEDRELTASETRFGHTLANTAAIGILQHRALAGLKRESRQLQHALGSRIVIEQAKGVLATRLGVDMPTAFEMMRGYARDHHSKLAEVAGGVVTGRLVDELLPPGPLNGRTAS